jgi:predicted transcriptional regulator
VIVSKSSGLDITAEAQIQAFQQAPPIDVTAIAKFFGINVWEDKNLGTAISGKLFPDRVNGGTSGYSIVVNATEAFVRKRFTVAHEIAHFLLHRNLIPEGVEDDTFYRSKLGSVLETQANALAANILMPYVLINQAVAQGINTVSGLAALFQVSQDAMKVRMGIPLA